MECKICARPASRFGVATVLGRYTVQYFRCKHCGFIQTETPYWLEEAYARAITRQDLGLVGRNILYARITPLIIVALYDRHARFLDYGGGYGMFVRLMRDHGFDFYRYDGFAENLFAAGFDIEDSPSATYEMVTAFEVFEHLAQPLEEIGKMLSYSCNVLFSTQLLPAPAPSLNQWWYYGLEHGQHVAFYSRDSLRQLALYFDLQLYSCGNALHLLTEKTLPPIVFSLLGRLGQRAPWLARLIHRRSLLPRDYAALTGRQLQ